MFSIGETIFGKQVQHGESLPHLFLVLQLHLLQFHSKSSINSEFCRAVYLGKISGQTWNNSFTNFNFYDLFVC